MGKVYINASGERITLNELTDNQVRREEVRMDAILRRRAGKHHLNRTDESLGNGERISWGDPFEELAEREEAAIREATVNALDAAQKILALDTVPEALVDRIRELVFEEFCQYEATLMEWLFAAGPHPLEVMRRLFAFVKKRSSRLLWDMGFREIGPLLKETHAAAALRCRVLFGALPSGWDKSDSARENMRTAQMGNHNRRGGIKLKKYPFSNN